MNKQQNQEFINSTWDKSIIPTLVEYIKIPNKSPMFDPDWVKHGYMDKAVELLSQWCKQHAVPGMKLEVVKLEGRTPVIFIEIPGKKTGTVLLYGHMDKQPEMTGWHADLGPWKPVIKEDRLYGRGGADDGYSIFAALTAVMSLQQQNIDHPRCVILIEACEESGSYDLPYYVDHLQTRIGSPQLVVCLDSGCGNYDQLWCTTSLRGNMNVDLTIQVLTEGVHSGAAGGIVPSPWLVLRQLLARLEDQTTGKVLPKKLNTDIPRHRIAEAKLVAEILKQQVYSEFPFQKSVQPLTQDLAELVLNRTWRPALTIIGIDGVPSPANAGNVLLPELKVRLAFRLPPSCEPKAAAQEIKQLLESNPPFGAKVITDVSKFGMGWDAPAWNEQLLQSINKASKDYFAQPAAFMGEGGTIPFMGMLGEKFPQAQFFIIGVLGPHSNAHGPNEFLHIPMAKKLTCCVAQVLAETNF